MNQVQSAEKNIFWVLCGPTLKTDLSQNSFFFPKEILTLWSITSHTVYCRPPENRLLMGLITRTRPSRLHWMGLFDLRIRNTLTHVLSHCVSFVSTRSSGFPLTIIFSPLVLPPTLLALNFSHYLSRTLGCFQSFPVISATLCCVY